MTTSTTFSPQDFLSQYWQRKPVIIKQFLSNFVDPIDEHDLAGLAEESDVDSRLVINGTNGWDVLQGPFSDLNKVCRDSWSLLVQGVDVYNEECSALMDKFNFIPHQSSNN